ncbi:MAG: response regulator [Ktedonobacterales bacterium]|nr:response regulator [Ktedonobacterales bacterium]
MIGHFTSPDSLILVVDDDVTIATLLCNLFADAGFTAAAAYSADEAFARALELLPSLILIDVMMPGGNGDKLVQRLQEQPATQHIPVALMSSDRPRLVHMSGVPFLPKPFDIEDVVAFVKRHVQMAEVTADVGDAREA